MKARALSPRYVFTVKNYFKSTAIIYLASGYTKRSWKLNTWTFFVYAVVTLLLFITKRDLFSYVLRKFLAIWDVTTPSSSVVWLACEGSPGTYLLTDLMITWGRLSVLNQNPLREGSLMTNDVIFDGIPLNGFDR